MATNNSKDAIENTTLDAGSTADETANTSSGESNTDSHNENAIEYKKETILSGGFDILRWLVSGDISSIQVYEDPSKKRTSKPSPFHSHTIARKLARGSPCHELALDIEAMCYIGTPSFKRPGRLVVCRADSDIMTIAYVIEQLSPYIRANGHDIF